MCSLPTDIEHGAQLACPASMNWMIGYSLEKFVKCEIRRFAAHIIVNSSFAVHTD
jgi:hypothetical protein